METLISNWSTVESLPESYVFPPERRPGKLPFPVCRDVPVIDLGDSETDRTRVIQQILDASQEFGFFQVINHGISEELADDTLNVFKEFFAMPAEYKAQFYSTDMNKSCRIYSSTMDYDKEKIHYWRDNFSHRCHPLEDYIQLWPEKPPRYREVVGKYSVEVRKFLFRILSLICEGLGLESGFFEGECSKIQLLTVNHHIPCPDPTLALGMPEHHDPNLITTLHQCDIPGLQVFRDGKWLTVDPLRNAFLVIPGLQFRAISNARFTSPKHRVVTHSEAVRTTIGNFLIPSPEHLIEPAGALIDESHPPVYRGYTYPEFLNTYMGTCYAGDALEKFFRYKPE